MPRRRARPIRLKYMCTGKSRTKARSNFLRTENQELRTDLEKIRINDLARELEVKSKAVIDYPPTIGINDKKSHSSSLDPDQAERVRKHFAGGDEKPSKAKSSAPAEAPGIKTKIDLSKISKPGDVLSAIRKQTSEPAPAPPRPVAVAPKPPAAPTPT